MSRCESLLKGEGYLCEVTVNKLGVDRIRLDAIQLFFSPRVGPPERCCDVTAQKRPDLCHYSFLAVARQRLGLCLLIDAPSSNLLIAVAELRLYG